MIFTHTHTALTFGHIYLLRNAINYLILVCEIVYQIEESHNI